MSKKKNSKTIVHVTSLGSSRFFVILCRHCGTQAMSFSDISSQNNYAHFSQKSLVTFTCVKMGKDNQSLTTVDKLCYKKFFFANNFVTSLMFVF